LIRFHVEGPTGGNLTRIKGLARNPGRILTRWLQQVAVSIHSAMSSITWQENFDGPVNFRDVAEWPKAKPLYVRKDGKVIPPWGGVPRVSAGWKKMKGGAMARHSKVTGNVRGRKRPSGARIKPEDIMMEDTQHMIREFTDDVKLSPDHKMGWLGTARTYARRQASRRPWERATPRDRAALVEIAEQEFAKEIR
jgi:hypothetical protein